MAKRGQAVRRSPTRSKVPTKPKGAPADADLKKEIATLRRELAEALERQTATSEVLQVISNTPGDLEPVFRACWRTQREFAGPISARCTLLRGTSLGGQRFTTCPLPTPMNSRRGRGDLIRKAVLVK